MPIAHSFNFSSLTRGAAHREDRTVRRWARTGRVRSAVAAIGACAAMASSASAQLPACEPYTHPTLAPCVHNFGSPVSPTMPATFASRCWYTPCANPLQAPSVGFPLNLSMGFGPAMGDYPPMTLNAAESTLPVVAREGSYHARAVPAATRPMLNGVVDLITGAPLLQETDFELAYGTAVFRHIRTYAETASIFRHEKPCTQGNWSGTSSTAAAPNHYWDWTGQGWMIGENPILLIDASYEGAVYPTGTRKCFFIVDAHHAIPFTLLRDRGEYEAPPRFDAIMDHDGVWDSTNDRWTTRPTEFRIWLQHQSVKYTIKAVYDDEVILGGISLSTPPHPNPSPSTNPPPNQPPWGMSQGTGTHAGREFGEGIPAYGLVTRIDDRYGNSVRMEYCDVGLLTAGEEPGSEPPCMRCTQQCNRKGRLSRVRLHAAGSEEPAWTIVYVGREFAPWITSPAPMPIGSQEAIHSIFVYKGGGPHVLPNCLTIPNQVFVDALGHPRGGPAAEWEADEIRIGLQRLNSVNAENLFTELDPNWVYKTQLLYAESSNLFKSEAAAPLFGDEEYWETPGVASPRLIRAAVYRQVPTINGARQVTLEKQSLYRYRSSTLPLHEGSVNGSLWDKLSMSAVWHNASIDAIRRAAEEDGGHESLLAHWPMGLLATPDDIEVPTWKDLETGTMEVIERPMLETATLSFRRWGEPGGSSDGERFGMFDHFVAQQNSGFRHDMVDDYIDFEQNSTVTLRDGVFTFVDRRGGGADGRVFKVYRFWNLEGNVRPWATVPDTGWHVATDGTASFGYDSQSAVFPFRLVMRDPFFFYGEDPGMISPVPETKKIPLDKPFWITVIDEYASLHDATFDPNQNYTHLTDALSTLGDRKPPRSRRVVHMNAAGFVLCERTWDFTSGTLSSEGMFEGFDYDDDGMLIEHRTYGWGNNQTQGSHAWPHPISPAHVQGLINRYAYSIGLDERRQGRSSAMGVQKGKPQAGTPTIAWVRQTIVHNERPELPRYEIAFKTPYVGPLEWENPLAAYAPGLADITRHEYGFKQGDSQQHMVWKKTIGPPAPRSPGGNPFYPFSCEVYDTNGNVVCRAYGSVKNPAQPGQQDDVLYVDALTYSAEGRLLSEVVDAESSPPGSAISFSRCAPGTALAHVTSYGYDSAGRVNRITYPNGRMDLVTERVSNETIETRKYQLVWVEHGRMYALLPGTVTQASIHGGSVGNMISAQWIDLGEITGLGNPPDPELMSLCGLIPLCHLIPDYDSSGRLSSMTIDGGDGASLTASIQYDYIGEITRQRDPDGTLTRKVHDPLGRLQRIFRGTTDRHPYWGTAPPHQTQYPDDNMIIVEGRTYGAGTTNARQLTEVITYRNVERNAAHDPTLPPGGSADVYLHDWRMRNVLVRHDGEAAPPGGPPPTLSWTATFLDNLGRVRFSATYGPDWTPGGPSDPTQIGFGGMEPTAQEIKTAAGQNLLRLSETIYNARGQVEEQRQYDPATGDGSVPLKHLSTRTFYDHAGRPLAIYSPNGGVQMFEYDAKGRQVVSRLMAGAEEVTRTQTEFDEDGNSLIVSVWERTHDGTGDVLSASNAVCTRTFNWYDKGNRLIATAELGADIHETQTAATGFVNSGGTLRPRGAAPVPVVNTSTGMVDSINLNGLPATCKVTCYEYDAAGRRIAVIQHNTERTTTGVVARPSVTRTYYNSLGQVTYQFENANDPAPNSARITAYAYQQDRLKKIGAILNGLIDVNWQTSVNHQVTELFYNAEVVNPGFTSFQIPNYNNAWVGEVRFPEPGTGLPSTKDRLVFKYFTDGRVAMRTDQRGVTFNYSYDVPGNLTAITVGNIAGTHQGGQLPADSIDLVEFDYDTLGNPLEVRAKAAGGSEWVAHNVMAYDSRGNLLFDRQSHGQAATSASPTVEYSWAYSAAHTTSSQNDGHNFDRLVSMLYPKRVQAPTVQRQVDLVYGATLAARDSLLGRVSRIDDNRLGEAAGYSYAGSSRRVAQRYGFDAGTQAAPVSQTYADTSQNPVVGYPGLDPHGRVRELAFRNAAPSNSLLAKFEYGHDQLDQRVFARVTQRNADGSPSENQRSWHYGYDRLGRLTAADLGALDAQNTSVAASGLVNPARESDWTMDFLGNWVGDPQTQTPGRRTLGVPWSTGPPREVKYTDVVDRTNAISTRSVVDASNPPVVKTLVHDAAGNLVLDESFFYQYDAWNRLVQVSAKGTLSANWVNGNLVWTGAAGGWIVHYTYDGLGRLIRKQSPWPTPDPYGRAQVRTEHFYYDGVRRVQETITDPIAAENDDPVTSEKEAELPPLQTFTLTTREYIHSPGYVDEVVAQVDLPITVGGADRPAWVIQDANFNLVGLVGDDGRLLHQYTWDPYGQPIAIDRYDTGINGNPPPFENRIGHQGLFFDRFDGGASNVLLPQIAVDPATGLGVKGLYQNRNRSYSPALGRFVQRDPNGLGQPLLLAGSKRGRRASTALSPFATDSFMSDGANIYQSVSSQPVTHTDPTGLFLELLGPTSTAEIEADHMQNVLEGGGNAIMAVLNMSAEYAGNMDAGVDWAEDMSLADDLLTPRMRWTSRRVGTSLNNAREEWTYAGGVRGNSAARHALKAGSAARNIRLGQIYDSYSEARAAVRASGRSGIECHHIVEVRHLSQWGDDVDGPAVLLSHKQHVVITNSLRRALPYGNKEAYNIAQVRRAYEKAYKNHPDLLERALEHLREIK